MKKKVLYTELAYVLGMVLLAFGAAFMTISDFGVSMIVAPAYLIHLKVSEFLPFFSFGMAEYTLQAVLLFVMMLVVRKAKVSYFFSIVTAVLYGFILDGAIAVVSLLPVNTALRVFFYIVGLLLSSMGVSFFFHTYIAPEVYELFVKEVSVKFEIDISKVKTVYDCASCVVSILLSFAFFGLWSFEGVKLGTVICALLNGTLIGVWNKACENIWDFKDRFDIKFLK